MASFKISAPSRIVLAGEHLASYQKYFVLTSLNRRTKLTFRELPEGWPIEIEFPDVNLQIQVPLEEVRGYFSEEQNNQLNQNFRIKYVKSFITFNGLWRTFQQRFSLQMFFCLLYSIAVNEKLVIGSFHVHVTSNIPLDAGLGSSTSFAVCLAACFLHWYRLQNEPHANIEFNHIDFLIDVELYVKYYEERLQDYQCTQIDTDVCVFGFVTISLLADYGEYAFEKCKEMARMKILLINSVYNWLDVISTNIRYANLVEQKLYYNNLQLYIRDIQILLRNYGLSNEAFDRIFTIADDIEYSAKLTGFGPKYAYIVLPPYITNNEIIEIATQLRNKNCLVISTSINCDGVRLEN
ncbi:mevalonate kinase-like isoform X2 [Nylanderia fulva]|uniref:mevalonate kinase-like isoform X2 n=1 Tax=Nylanderia fulva TaxID=613905 RepID=UPI0010FAFE12|nr:mevalonate kinase-like isoform X2 [Nylanderia fulva]